MHWGGNFMKILNVIVFISSVMPFCLFAQTITATGDTLEHAESQIRQQVHKDGGKTYKIIEARMGNKVHVTAEILP